MASESDLSFNEAEPREEILGASEESPLLPEDDVPMETEEIVKVSENAVEGSRFPDDIHTQAYDLFAVLPGGTGNCFKGQPPNVRLVAEPVMARFLVDTDRMVVDRGGSQGEMLLPFEFNGQVRICPENGFRGEEEMGQLYSFLVKEKAYQTMSPADQKASWKRTKDESKTDMMVHKISKSVGVPQRTQTGCAPLPEHRVTPRENGFSMFFIRNAKFWIARYSGAKKLIDNCELPSNASEVLIERWRDGKPAPRHGFESDKEASDFGKFINWKYKVMMVTKKGEEPPIHPDLLPPSPPPVEPYKYGDELLEGTKQIARQLVAQQKCTATGKEVLPVGYDTSAVKCGNVASLFHVGHVLHKIQLLEEEVAKMKEAQQKLLEDTKQNASSPTRDHRKRDVSPKRNSSFRKGQARDRRYSSERRDTKRSREDRASDDTRGYASGTTTKDKNEAESTSAPSPSFVRVVNNASHVASPAQFLRTTSGQLPGRRADQQDTTVWPESIWKYRIGGHNLHRPPHIYKGRDKILWPIDLPRGLRYVPASGHPTSNTLYENPEVDLDGLLAYDKWDPDYRNLNPKKIRAAFYAYYAATPSCFPPKSMNLTPDTAARYKSKKNGRNYGDDCLYCFGPHFSGYCIIFVRASHKRRLLELRGSCLLCKGTHNSNEHCTGGDGYVCTRTECNKEHHLELCTHTFEDQERQAMHEED